MIETPPSCRLLKRFLPKSPYVKTNQPRRACAPRQGGNSMNQRLWRASRVRRALLAGSSVLALLALASPAEAIPGDCLDALKTSGDPFLVGFANGITPVGQLFCLGTQPGITVGIATPGVQEIFFGIGNEVVNGNVTVLETTNLGNEGIG